MRVFRVHLPRRDAAVLRALRAHVRGGEARVLTATLARELAIDTKYAGQILRRLAEAGYITPIEVGSRSQPGRWRVTDADIVDANRPRGATAVRAKATRAARSGHAAALFDWIAARVDDAGTIDAVTRDMAAGAGVPVSAADSLLAQWKAAGFATLLRHGSGWHKSRWWFDVARRDEAVEALVMHPTKAVEATRGPVFDVRSRGMRNETSAPARPDQPLSPRQLPRCPYDELPAGHRLCRHGWNGLTTMAQRAMIAAAAGNISPLAAA